MQEQSSNVTKSYHVASIAFLLCSWAIAVGLGSGVYHAAISSGTTFAAMAGVFVFLLFGAMFAGVARTVVDTVWGFVFDHASKAALARGDSHGAMRIFVIRLTGRSIVRNTLRSITPFCELTDDPEAAKAMCAYMLHDGLDVDDEWRQVYIKCDHANVAAQAEMWATEGDTPQGIFARVYVECPGKIKVN